MFIPEKLRQALPKKKSKNELDKHYADMEHVELEKGDFLAMCIAALITFLPVLIIAMVAVFGILWLLVW